MFVVLAGACEGEAGPEGPGGAQGPAGPQGSAGTNGTDGRNGTNGSDGQDGMNGMNGMNGTNGRDATVDPLLSPLEKAFAGIGGRDALAAMTSYRLHVTTKRYAPGEGFAWDDAPVLAHTASATIAQNIAADAFRSDVSRDVVFFGSSVPQSFRIYRSRDLGHVEGIESIFGAPTGDLLSDGVAAMRKEQRLLNPVLLLNEIIATPSIAEEGGAAVLDGSVHHLLVVDQPVHPITLWINAQTGRITKATTVENNHLTRDTELQAFYLGWEPAANGPSFPKVVMIAEDAHVLYEETRRTVEVNPALGAGYFDLPAGANPAFDAALEDRGLRSSEFHQSFAGIGIRIDGIQSFVQPTLLSPGVWFLAGGSHNSLAIEQANGVVIVEPPLYQERSEALLAWAATQFPTKPVSHIAVTHFHHDHSGGVRTFIAAGARLVVGEASVPLYRQVINAPSTIVPDAQSESPRNPEIIAVARGSSVTLPDLVRPVTLFDVTNSHSNDMLTAYVPNGQIVFVSDIYSPGLPPFVPGWAAEYYDSIVADGLDASAVTTVAGGHGGTGTFDELRIAAGR